MSYLPGCRTELRQLGAGAITRREEVTRKGAAIRTLFAAIDSLAKDVQRTNRRVKRIRSMLVEAKESSS